MPTPLRSAALSSALLAMTTIAGSATAQFSFNKVELKSNVTLSQLAASNGNDCWGYVSPSGREYALMCTNDRLTVVEITNPSSPVIVGFVSHSNSFTGDVKVYQDHAYVVNDSGGGLDVIDLSNVDNGQVTLVQRATPGGFDHAHNIAIDTDSGFLYLGVGNINSGSTVALDLSNPANPTIAGSYSGSRSHDLQVVTYTSGPNAGKQIAFSFSESRGVDIIDVTNKSNMFLLSRSTYPNTQYCHQGWVSDDKQFLYLNDELDGEQRTTVFDIADLSNPQLLDSFSATTNATDHNLYVRNGFIFEANYRSGLRIFDTNVDPVNPPEVGWFDTFTGGNGPGFEGAWSCFPFFPSGLVIVSDVNRGLFVLDPSEAVGGGNQSDAQLIDVTRTLGLYISGGTAELSASDDTYYVLQSGPGFNPTEPHPARADFRFDSAGFPATTLDITVEEKANIGGPTAVVLLRNRVNMEWDEIARHGLSPTDQTFEMTGIPATEYIGAGQGRIKMRVRSFAILILDPTIRAIFSHDYIRVNMRE